VPADRLHRTQPRPAVGLIYLLRFRQDHSHRRKCHEKCHWLQGRLHEAARQIELLGRFVQGMYQHCEYTRVAGDMNGAQHGVAQESAAEPAIVITAINGQSSQQQYGQLLGHVPLQALGRGRAANTSGRKAVIADNGALFANDEAADAWFLSARRFSQSSRDGSPHSKPSSTCSLASSSGGDKWKEVISPTAL
jgi:hypothetical protein